MVEDRKRPARVLLVVHEQHACDEQDLVDFLAQRLLKRGYTVHAATTGPDAIAAARNQTFDVAVVDLKMPQMDGIQVIEQLKDMQPHLETIMLTGHGSTDSALQAGKLQTFRYLLKPYDFGQLVEQIDDAVATRRQTLRDRFEAELEKVIGSNASPREIIHESERLRREYEQD
ncbi:MAG: response regulator [Candidatus Krumholzibacteriia bacterium]